MVDFHKESHYLTKLIFKDKYQSICEYEYVSKDRVNKPYASAIFSLPCLNETGLNLVIFSSKRMNEVRLDPRGQRNVRGENFMPECLRNKNPHSWTQEDIKLVFDTIMKTLMNVTQA